MKEVLEAAYLEDLKSFRWELFHHRHSKEVIKCLTRYYFKKYNFQHFAEEIVIAGYDLQNVRIEKSGKSIEKKSRNFEVCWK